MCCMIEGNRTHDHDRHTNGTQDTTGTRQPEKRGTPAKRKKPEYICMIAGNAKKYKKKLKKIWN